MVIAKPSIHMICGACGCNERFEFCIDPKGSCDKDGKEFPAVFILCLNCCTLTGLDEIIKEKGKNE